MRAMFLLKLLELERLCARDGDDVRVVLFHEDPRRSEPDASRCAG
jgi:hypothetical protein